MNLQTVKMLQVSKCLIGLANVSVEMKDGDFDRFLCELENFYEGFDPDYETYLPSTGIYSEEML